MNIARAIWFGCGCVSLGLAAIGVVLPVVPTTPFVILAAFFFGKSSPRIEAWLIANPTFGPMILDWRAHGSIRLRYKIISAVAMSALFLLSLAMGVRGRVLAVQAVCMIGAAIYVWTRPSGPTN